MVNSGALYIVYDVFQAREVGIALTTKCNIFNLLTFIHDLYTFDFCNLVNCFGLLVVNLKKKPIMLFDYLRYCFLLFVLKY